MKHCHKPITDFTNLVQFDSRSQVPKHSVYISHSVISSGYTEAHKFQKKMQNKWRHLKNDNTDSWRMTIQNQRESKKDTISPSCQRMKEYYQTLKCWYQWQLMLGTFWEASLLWKNMTYNQNVTGSCLLSALRQDSMSSELKKMHRKRRGCVEVFTTSL